MNKTITYAIGVILFIALVGGIVISLGDNEEQLASTDMDARVVAPVIQDAQSATDETAAESVAARYIDYSPQKLANSESSTNLIFFHAAWCSVCNSVERAIEAGSIPEDVTIFKVDYDSDEGQALARKYGIPIQYSTVQVDTDGNELTQWVNQYNDGVAEMLSRTVEG